MRLYCSRILGEYISMDTGTVASPQLPLHRVLTPLCWENDRKRSMRADGKVKQVVGSDGQRVLMVQKQPQGRSVAGVSLFVPLTTVNRAVHTYLGSEGVGCVVTQPNIPLPADLRLFNDRPEVELPHRSGRSILMHTAPQSELDGTVSLSPIGLRWATRCLQQAQPFGRRRLRNAIFGLKGRLSAYQVLSGSYISVTFQLTKRHGPRSTVSP